MGIAAKCTCGKQMYYCGQNCPNILNNQHMELKELREQAAKEWVRYVPTLSAQEDFIGGAEWECKRDKWVRPEDQLPPESEGEPHLSDIVLIKIKGGGTNVAWYDFVDKSWSNENQYDIKVISWTFIPLN
jgi:hypothetical protein